MTSSRSLWLTAAVSLALFVSATVLVQLRALAAFDLRVLQVVDATRPSGLVELVNWIFRLGYAQIDAVVAVGWAGWLYWRRRLLAVTLAPLLFFGVVAAEVTLRLVVNQPAPDQRFAVNRVVVGQPVVTAIDRADATARQSFAVTTQSAAGPAAERGSFPSGHSGRSLFLALVILAGQPWTARRWIATIAVSGLIGYSALYFGYHWPSDVAAGYLLAAAFYQPARWLREHASTCALRGFPWLPQLTRS